jgi:hypothetical protein
MRSACANIDGAARECRTGMIRPEPRVRTESYRISGEEDTSAPAAPSNGPVCMLVPHPLLVPVKEGRYGFPRGRVKV